MALKGGDLIHIANMIVVDRAQTAGPGTVNINREKIYELGNYNSVGMVSDIPDTTWSLESFDASAEFEAILTGKVFSVANGIQTITIKGSPTGGTFTLTFDGQTTSGIAYNAAASAVQTALRALSSVPSSTLAVTGNAGGPYTVTLSGALVTTGAVSLITKNAASLTGGTSPDVTVVGSEGEAMADGTVLKPAESLPIDVASIFKRGKTDPNKFDVAGSVAIPYLTLESLSYRFGVTDNASQQASLRGDSVYYSPSSTYIEEFVGSGTAGQTVTLSHLAVPYKGDKVAGTRYSLSVATVSGKRLSYGTDFTEAPSGGGTNKTLVITITDAVAITDRIRVVYASPAVATYPQIVHAIDSATRPAAIRGRDIEVYVGGTALSDRWNSVQSVNIDYRVTLQRDEEFGNSQIVAQDYDVPDVTGSITIRPRDYAELYKRMRQIANVVDGEVVGALTTQPLDVVVVLHSPTDGSVLKTFLIPDARFNLPGFSGRVQQKLDLTLDFTSDTGDLTIYKGPMP